MDIGNRRISIVASSEAHFFSRTDGIPFKSEDFSNVFDFEFIFDRDKILKGEIKVIGGFNSTND